MYNFRYPLPQVVSMVINTSTVDHPAAGMGTTLVIVVARVAWLRPRSSDL